MTSRKPMLRLRTLTAATLLALSGTSFAQEMGSAQLEGTVSTDGNHFVDGAVIEIPALNRRVASKRDGSFRFASLPAGEYELLISYPGTETIRRTVTITENDNEALRIELNESSEELDELVIYAQRSQLANSIARERASDTIVSSVTSDEVGRFPDQNVAEAVKRLPGLSVDRDKGEARFVVIRGADPSLNAQSINGIRVNSPEADTRAVAFDVIPSELLESIDVIKAITPDQPGDAVGGIVEINTLSAFDRKERLSSFSVEGSYDDLSGETSPKLSATFSDTVALGDNPDALGISFALSWYDREFSDYNSENGDGWELLDAPDGSGEYRFPIVIEQRADEIRRRRAGAVLNFDLRPSDNTELYLRTLYSAFKDHEDSSRNAIEFDEDSVVSLGDRTGQFEAFEFVKELKDRTEEQNIFSAVLGGESYFTRWALDYQLGYSYSEENETPRYNAEFVYEDEEFDGNTFGYDQSTEDYYVLSGTFPAGAYEFDEASFEENLTEDTEYSLGFNAERDLSYGGYPGIIKMGTLLRWREKSNDHIEPVYEGIPEELAFDAFARDRDYGLGPFGPGFDTSAWRRFFNERREEFELNAEDTAIKNAEGDYSADENVYAAYIMSQADIGRLRLTGGVRVEQTRFDARGASLIVNADGDESVAPAFNEQDYSNVLPSLVARFDASDRLIYRAALSRTIKRPNIEQVVPLQEINFEDSEAFISNPELDALQSDNLDLMVSWYPTRLSVVSGGVFFKRIEDYIVNANVAGGGQLDDALVGFEQVIQPINGDSADLRGLELNYEQSLRMLPAPWDGLLFSANYTLVDSEAELALADRSIPLPKQSDQVANLAVGYEKYGWSLRLAMSYRSEFLNELLDPEDPAFDSYRDAHLQWDLSAAYALAEGWEINAEVANLNQRNRYEYFGSSAFNSEYEEYSYTFNLGLTGRF